MIGMACGNWVLRAEVAGGSGGEEKDVLRDTGEVCRNELAAYFARQHKQGYRVSKKQEALPAATLERLLGEAVLGQDAAIRAVADAIELRSLGLDLRPQRPLSFLFCGPTGVGKTELAVALSRALFEGKERLLRVDCSEYGEAHQVSRLLGAPPSYIGYGTASPLEEFLKSGGGGVLLLDEFEKGHAALHRLFLQALDAGRLTNSRGTTLDLSGLVVIATTNAGLRPTRCFGYGAAKAGEGPELRASLADLSGVYSPELLNRFDAVVAFRPLDRTMAREILRRHLVAGVQELVRTRYGVTLEVEEAVEDMVLQRGYSATFGARHLQRAFASVILRPLAMAIRSGLPAGGRLEVGCTDDGIAVSG